MIMVQQLPVIPLLEEVDWFQYNTKAFSGFPSPSNAYAQPGLYNIPDWGVVLLHLKPIKYLSVGLSRGGELLAPSRGFPAGSPVGSLDGELLHPPTHARQPRRGDDGAVSRPRESQRDTCPGGRLRRPHAPKSDLGVLSVPR